MTVEAVNVRSVSINPGSLWKVKQMPYCDVDTLNIFIWQWLQLSIYENWKSQQYSLFGQKKEQLNKFR